MDEFLRGAIEDLPKSASEQDLGKVHVKEGEEGWSWDGQVGWKLEGEEEECGWVGIVWGKGSCHKQTYMDPKKF